MLWLDADTLIRKMTQNKKSLDDFVKIFLGKGGNTGPLIVTYTFDELVQDLNQVVPYDWATFLHDRVDKINPHVDVAGLEQGGYKLVFKDKPTKSERMMAAAEGREAAAWIAGTRSDCGSGQTGPLPMCCGTGLRTRRVWRRARRSWR